MFSNDEDLKVAQRNEPVGQEISEQLHTRRTINALSFAARARAAKAVMRIMGDAND